MLTIEPDENPKWWVTR